MSNPEWKTHAHKVHTHLCKEEGRQQHIQKEIPNMKSFQPAHRLNTLQAPFSKTYTEPIEKTQHTAMLHSITSKSTDARSKIQCRETDGDGEKIE